MISAAPSAGCFCQSHTYILPALLRALLNYFHWVLQPDHVNQFVPSCAATLSSLTILHCCEQHGGGCPRNIATNLIRSPLSRAQILSILMSRLFPTYFQYRRSNGIREDINTRNCVKWLLPNQSSTPGCIQVMKGSFTFITQKQQMVVAVQKRRRSYRKL